MGYVILIFLSLSLVADACCSSCRTSSQTTCQGEELSGVKGLKVRVEAYPYKSLYIQRYAPYEA